MKLAITGKGGVGKTTLAGLLARLYAQEGYRVLAIDADPDANLASAVGFAPAEAARIAPISGMADLIEERTGARPGSQAPIFRLNPRVDDIPDRFSAVHEGVKLLVMGTVKKGGSGCVCPENVLLRQLVSHLLLGRQEVVILDMEAGIEHLGRATAQAVDALIVVVEPGRRSLQTAEQIRTLAADIHIPRVFVVGSKVQGAEDEAFVREGLPDTEVLGFVSLNPEIAEADRRGVSPFDLAPRSVAEARSIRDRLMLALDGTSGTLAAGSQ
ncbi:MAG: carbon monoxide dehydrogenase accessory protein CooC [Bacteroidetes bacterium]|nr:carbon monoxide dehydrogenase accessory protein CooC [Bacteroidota bacterium]MCL5026906.1 carbon monoxide dehydrogenase accessory protein CooC [Chloroflexota bacterium]